MVVTDMVILPLGCALCGLLLAAPTLLGSLPILRPVVYAFLPWKAPIGLATAIAGLICLPFPYHGPPLIGSLLPAALGAVAGITLSLDILLDLPFLRKHRRALAAGGNALLYLKIPLGLLSLTIAILHLCFPKAAFV